MPSLRSRLSGLAVASAVAAGVLTSPALSADAASPIAGAAAKPAAQSPPGANDWSCKPSQEHPFPVVLVEGTFENMLKNWLTMSPYLKDKGYCIFALNYGKTHGVQATGPIGRSAQELSRFVDKVLDATGASEADLVGHSQGGMMPRYYMRFLGGAAKVNHLIGIAPSNRGTTTPIQPPPGFAAGSPCKACSQQMAGSAFLTKLNAGRDIEAGPSYTVISTIYDEVVTPYTSQALAGPATQVTNLVIQDYCPLDTIEHDQTPNDPVVQQIVAAALSHNSGPADPGFQPDCT